MLYEVRPNTAVGMNFGWNTFNVITPANDVTSLENIDVGGTKFRYTNSFPMLVTVRQFTGSRRGPRFFYGLGVGTQYVKQAVDVSLWRISDSTWHFAFAPEIGVVIPSGNMNFFFNTRYNYGLKASDQTQSYFGINVGLAWQTSGF
jgi:outer membrane protein